MNKTQVTLVATAVVVAGSSAAFFIANKLKKDSQETPETTTDTAEDPFNVQPISVS